MKNGMEIPYYSLYYTAQIDNDVTYNRKVADAVNEARLRFDAGDFGNIDDEDKAENERELQEGAGHVLGRYRTPNGDIYINLDFGAEYRPNRATVMYCYEA